MNFKIKNSLLKNAGVYTITNVINATIPFFLLPILTRFMSPSEFGIVSMFALLVASVTPFIGLSLNGAIERQFFNREEIDIAQYIGNCIIILLISSSIVGILFASFSNEISKITSFPEKLLWIVVVYTFAQFIISIVLTIWQVQKKSIQYGILNISKTLINISLSIILVVFLELGYSGRIFGQFIALAIFAVFSILYLVRKQWLTFSFNKVYIMHALSFGIPLIPHALSGTIISMTDRFFITNMVDLSATGIYTVGYQIGSLINLLTSSFNVAYVPWLYERLKLGDEKTKIKIVKFTYSYFVLILIFSLFFGLVSPYFLGVLLGNSFSDSSSFVIWISLGYAFNGMYLMVVNYLFYAQRTKELAAVTFITAILNVILNYVFINESGAIGAAQATSITFLIKFILVWYISQRMYKMPWNLKKALKNI